MIEEQNRSNTQLTSKEEVVELSKGYLKETYQIKVNSPLTEFNTEHAKAYEVIDSTGQIAPGGLYAFVFNAQFPTRLQTIKRLQTVKNPLIQQLHDYGKVVLSNGQSEKFAVILERPQGIPIKKYVEQNQPFAEKEVVMGLSKQLTNALISLSDHNIVHGSINADKVYYNKDTGRILIGECISDICGNSQYHAYDAIDQLLCQDACKGDMDTKGDFYSMGVLLLFLLSSKRPFYGFSKELISHIRLSNGSYESSIVFIRMRTGFSISKHMDNLIKGLLSDSRAKRWGLNEIEKWHNKEEPAPSMMRLHKQAPTPFEFNDREYYSRKSLAQELFLHWEKAKREVQIPDIVRWLSLSVKAQELAQDVNQLTYGVNTIIISDNKLMRVITLLDPDGPIRFQNFSGHISGIGFELANHFINKDTEQLEQLSKLINSGSIEYWIANQSEDSDFRLRGLNWRPQLIRKHLAKKGTGFGMERVLYELNPGMPCQSPLLENYYVVTLEELLESLDRFSGNKQDETPVDRHIGAFIASRIDMSDDLRVKSLKNFPHFGKNPEVINTSMLSIAQAEGRVGQVKNLTNWMSKRLDGLVDSLNSRVIKKQLRHKLDEATETGNINELFKVLADPNFARRDVYGFAEARNQYRHMEFQIQRLQTQSNIQRMAYQLGLRIAVTISYLICASTLVYVVLQGAS
jgi:serine/threonine protein kinase